MNFNKAIYFTCGWLSTVMEIERIPLLAFALLTPYRLCIILASHHRIIIFNTGKLNAKLWRPRGWLTKTRGFPATHYILLYVMRGPWRCRSDPKKGPSLWHLERSQAADMKMCLSNTHQFIWSTGVKPQTKSNVPAEHIVSSVISKKKKDQKNPKTSWLSKVLPQRNKEIKSSNSHWHHSSHWWIT